MKENQNPTEEKPAYAIKGKDTTIIWVTSISTNSSSIYLQLKEKVYPIWSGDMHTDKSRETFYELYNGFVSPKVVLKL